MQVANALNDHIRILFNPKVEAFKLFDFLIVKSDINRYLAQITEIYEDKFDASQNVAKLKLFYKVNQNNEVIPYDNFTPSKECEIIRINQEEIENFINQDRETFSFATNAKDSTPLNMQYEFFFNKALILADKVENANTISLNLAKNLSNKKPVVIIDSTGILEFEGAKKIKASKNFKMPLNYLTIDYIFEKCLKDSSLEFQAIGTEIINEVKKFARSQEGSFIPFNGFVKVISEQYKVTPYPELRLLLARIKKLQMDEIFARTKKDNELLVKTIQKNSITIIDLSSIETGWQKAFLEYIVSAVEDDICLVARINEETFDTDLINKIYNQKTNINFIPTVSYNYRKLPTIIQYCKNYILMPSLYQRSDFLDANFALCNLISGGCIVFGQNTDNFLYIASDIEAKASEKKINYRKINLSSDKKEQSAAEKKPYAPQISKEEDDEDIKNSQKLINELIDFEEEQLKKIEIQEKESSKDKQTLQKDAFETLINNEQPFEAKNDDNKNAIEEIKTLEGVEDTETHKTAETLENVEINKNVEDIETLEDVEGLEGVKTLEDAKTIEEIETLEDVEEIKTLEDSDIEESNDEDEEPEPEVSLNHDFENLLINEEHLNILGEAPEEEKKPKVNVLDAEIIEFGQDVSSTLKPVSDSQREEISKRVKEALQKESIEITPAAPQKEQAQEEALSDEELDFFQIAKESSLTAEKEQVVIDNVEYKIQSETQKPSKPKKASKKVKEALEAATKEENSDIDLKAMADQSAQSSFEEIINSETKSSKEEVPKVDIQEEQENEILPIYTEEQEENAQTSDFKKGDSVVHAKYGRGVVVKIIEYEQRKLLQIEFEGSGKKLLDPKVAQIQPG